MAGSTCVQSALAASSSRPIWSRSSGDHFGLLEQLAVEARQRFAQHHREAAGVHLAPERGEQRDKLLRVALQGFEQRGESALAVLFGQQADVFGEHREQAAGEKAGDEFGWVARLFKRPRDARQMHGDFARDLGRGARGVERQRVEPQGFEACAEVFVGKIGQADAVRARVGERRVGGAGAGEVGVQLDDVADVDDDQERRPAFFGRQGAGVAFGLAAGALQGVVESLAGNSKLDLLGFEDEVAAPVAVDAPGRAAAVAVAEGDAALEDVGVVACILARRVGRLTFVRQLPPSETRTRPFRVSGYLLYCPPFLLSPFCPVPLFCPPFFLPFFAMRRSPRRREDRTLRLFVYLGNIRQ